MSPPNNLQSLVKHFPDKPWNWHSLSANPNITWDFVRDNPTLPWNLRYLSKNPNITWGIVLENPNPFAKETKTSRGEWDYNLLSINPNITCDIIRQNPDRPWSMYFFSANRNITWDFVKTSGRPMSEFNPISLSSNPNITPKIISENPRSPRICAGLDSGLKWDAYGFSKNPNVTWDFLQTHPIPFPGYDWDWNVLSEHLVITPEIMSHIVKSIREETLDTPLNWYCFSRNPSVTPELITSYPGPFSKDIDWDPVGLSENPNINLEFVLQFLLCPTMRESKAPWKSQGSLRESKASWKSLSANPGITWSDIESTLDTPGFNWKWEHVSKNPNLTFRIIQDHEEIEWDWECLSSNLFERHPIFSQRRG